MTTQEEIEFQQERELERLKKQEMDMHQNLESQEDGEVGEGNDEENQNTL